MRVLLAPEVYRPDDLSANGTVADAATWVGEWLARDSRLHVYWLLPPRDRAGYDPADVHADRDRVTLLQAEPPLYGEDGETRFTEGGYSDAQLRALHRGIFDPGGYVDAVIDGHRTGRADLYKQLLARVDQWVAAVRPFDVVAHVHDLQLPRKYRYAAYRNRFQWRMEACGAAFADGVWFKAGADRRAFRDAATAFLREDVVEAALDGAVETGSPLDLSGFEESYADRPRWLHLAGSLWAKKGVDDLLAVGRRLHDWFGIGTLLTSMEPIPDRYRDLDWVDAYGEADRSTYERALDRGDLALCASAYETNARTPFEQAASGQVLLVRDRPWVADSVPRDHPHVVAGDALGDAAVAAVESWPAAVERNRRLVDHARRARSPERSGRRTYADLRERVDRKLAAFARGGDGAAAVAAVERALDDLRAERGETEAVPLDAVVARSRALDDAGDALGDAAIEDPARTDVLYALRSLGYRDTGRPGTPALAPAD